MKIDFDIKLKAAFLLCVFSMNTLVGFACSIGIDLGFNSESHHHHDDEKEESSKACTADLKDGHTEKHHEECHSKCSIENEDIKGACFNDVDEDGNCCNNSVVKFVQLDKSIVHPSPIIHPIFYTALLSLFYQIDLLKYLDAYTFAKYFVRGHHPPIPDIRIAIQSFQI